MMNRKTGLIFKCFLRIIIKTHFYLGVSVVSHIRINLKQFRFVFINCKRYTGIIKAGYETSEIKSKVGEGKIYITLPKAKILSHEIDEKSLEVLDESKNIFNPITIEDYNSFQITQKEFTEEKAISDGLFNEAENNVKEMINLAISSVKGIDDYEVVFK